MSFAEAVLVPGIPTQFQGRRIRNREEEEEDEGEEQIGRVDDP